jgi:hypothetical protein
MRRLLKLSCIAILAVLATASYSQSFLNTLAWTRYISSGDGGFSVDELGNTYLLYDTSDSVAGTTACHFIRYDTSGNAAAVSLPLTINAYPCSVNSVRVTGLIGGKRYVYALLGAYDSTGNAFLEIVKLNDSGVLQWNKTAATGSATEFVFPLNSAVDSAGDFIVCDRFFTKTGPSTGTSTFQSIVWDGTGAVIHYYFDNTIYPSAAELTQGNWSVLGSENGVAASTPRWVEVNPVNGSEVGQLHYPAVDNLKDSYRYLLSPTLDSSGFLYLGVTVVETQDSDSSVVAINHFIRKYTPSGVLLWTSKSWPSPVISFSASPTANSLWMIVQDSGFNRHLEQFDANGNLVTSTPAFSPYVSWLQKPDSTGEYLLYTDSNSRKRLIAVRIGPAGTILWNLNTATTAGAPSSFSGYLDAQIQDGNLYTLAALPQFYQLAVQRYVRGTALLSIGGGTVSSNSTITLKVSLNAAAPAGGSLVKMTSNNGKLLFPNNLTSYSLAIPAGSTYANVVVHSATVATNTSVTVSGNLNGVIRASLVSVVP